MDDARSLMGSAGKWVGDLLDMMASEFLVLTATLGPEEAQVGGWVDRQGAGLSVDGSGGWLVGGGGGGANECVRDWTLNEVADAVKVA